MNIAEHPQSVGITKRINESPNKSVPAQIFLPALGQVMGVISKVPTVPGLFSIMTNARIEGSSGKPTQEGVVSMEFSGDQPIMIIYPNLTEQTKKSRIIT